MSRQHGVEVACSILMRPELVGRGCERVIDNRKNAAPETQLCHATSNSHLVLAVMTKAHEFVHFMDRAAGVLVLFMRLVGPTAGGPPGHIFAEELLELCRRQHWGGAMQRRLRM